ncbi:hypothetical protein [Longimicrobium sp.]|uniref:hypothetical protein n=1 Tax=Longimicrobium sp. TaxID=2029185 RepID=UPI003B3A7009
MSVLEEEARRRARVEDIARWRSLAGGAVCILSLLAAGYVIAGVPVTGPLPLREELVRTDGTARRCGSAEPTTAAISYRSVSKPAASESTV